MSHTFFCIFCLLLTALVAYVAIKLVRGCITKVTIFVAPGVTKKGFDVLVMALLGLCLGCVV